MPIRPLLLCPLDHLPLTMTATGAACASGHCFDRAKEGYLNVLPVQAKQAKDPGDSALMVQARRAFLATGAYDPVMQAITQHCAGASIVLDAGCGEGGYLRHLKTASPDTICYGVDISKHAVRAAAKSHKDIHWLVASNKALPFQDAALDVIVCAFGFPVWPEFRRVLHAQGRVLLADPGPDHLVELRRKLYDDIRPKPEDFKPPEGFALSATHEVRATFTPSGPALRDLIAMTPHQHRAAPDRIAAVLDRPPFGLTLDGRLRILQAA